MPQRGSQKGRRGGEGFQEFPSRSARGERWPAQWEERGASPKAPSSPGKSRPARGRPFRPEGSPGRSPRARPEPPRPRRPREPEPRKRPRKPLGKGARRLLLGITLLVMAAVTAALCVFLLFKIRLIQVTGDPVYAASEILDLCGFKEGENLVFLVTEGKEELLEEKLPYIEEAQIRRNFPSTLEIHIIAAQQAACVAGGGQWYLVSGSGKLLEEAAQPPEGVMEVTGVTLKDPVLGQPVQAEDENALGALREILGSLKELGCAGDFTSLDLTDLYNITMLYQDRILFQLGSTVELAYKMDLAMSKVLPQMDGDETGVLDLSLAADVKRAYFTEGPIEATPAPSQGEEASGESSEESGEETSSESSEGEDSSQDRGGDIPNSIYQG